MITAQQAREQLDQEQKGRTAKILAAFAETVKLEVMDAVAHRFSQVEIKVPAPIAGEIETLQKAYEKLGYRVSVYRHIGFFGQNIYKAPMTTITISWKESV